MSRVYWNLNYYHIHRLFPSKITAPLVFGSLVALLMVVFQGWLGSIVVQTELMPGMITLHDAGDDTALPPDQFAGLVIS